MEAIAALISAITKFLWLPVIIWIIKVFKEPLLALLPRLKKTPGGFEFYDKVESIEAAVYEVLEEGKVDKGVTEAVQQRFDSLRASIEGPAEKSGEDTNRVIKFETNISPQRVKQGNSYTTQVHFEGTVQNGFFDNFVTHLETGFKRWNWDPKTLKEAGHLTPGELNGYQNIDTSYSHSTTGWPKGTYHVFVRLYSHTTPGEKGRPMLVEQRHDLYIE